MGTNEVMPVSVPSTVPGVKQVLSTCFFIHLLTPVPRLSVGDGFQARMLESWKMSVREYDLLH